MAGLAGPTGANGPAGFPTPQGNHAALFAAAAAAAAASGGAPPGSAANAAAGGTPTGPHPAGAYLLSPQDQQYLAAQQAGLLQGELE
jgi:hypothetical protein